MSTESTPNLVSPSDAGGFLGWGKSEANRDSGLHLGGTPVLRIRLIPPLPYRLSGGFGALTMFETLAKSFILRAPDLVRQPWY